MDNKYKKIKMSDNDSSKEMPVTREPIGDRYDPAHIRNAFGERWALSQSGSVVWGLENVAVKRKGLSECKMYR